MISPKVFYEELKFNNINFITGVPDSLLKNVIAYISDISKEGNHIVSANEGAGVALAVGYHLATNEVPLVYMQNSGLGNAVNPILSIADEMVYGIPMILLVGWRGEPNLKDEPQHLKQGLVTEELLKSIDIPYQIIDADSEIKSVIAEAKNKALELQKPVAILVRKNTFEDYKDEVKPQFNLELSREQAIEIILENIDDSIVVSTTGKASREVYEIRESHKQSHNKDFLTVGGMGHTSQIATGIALAKKEEQVFCLDGDGSVIMHMGSLATIGHLSELNNFNHIVLNNLVHDSVGGQKTVASTVDFCKVAEACNYSKVVSVSTKKELENIMPEIIGHKGKVFLEILINRKSRKDLGRPTTTTKENKVAFKNFLKG